MDSDPSSTLVASAIIRSAPKISNDYRRRSQTAQKLEDFEPYPPAEVTREDERAHTILALPGELQPEYKLIEKHNIVSVSGEMQPEIQLYT